MDFSQIVLSDEEKDILEKLSEKHLQSSSIPSEILDRLINLKFVESDFVVQTDTTDSPEKIYITASGKDYLLWFHQKDGEKKHEKKQHTITTIMGVIGAFVALAALLWQACTWIYENYRKDGALSSSGASASACSFSCFLNEIPSAEEQSRLPKGPRQ